MHPSHDRPPSEAPRKGDAFAHWSLGEGEKFSGLSGTAGVSAARLCQAVPEPLEFNRGCGRNQLPANFHAKSSRVRIVAVPEAPVVIGIELHDRAQPDIES